MSRFYTLILVPALLLLLAHSSSFAAPATEETIELNDTCYAIPAPWKGNRLITPSYTMDDFAMIPREYARDEMRLYILKDTQTALVKMLTAASEDGLEIEIESGYRSRGYQKKIFLRMLQEGREFHDIIRYVAPPGYSEHGLGIAVDFSPSNWEFAKTEAYMWLQQHAEEFGFSESFPRKNIHNYPWESWHWAYHPPETDPFDIVFNE